MKSNFVILSLTGVLIGLFGCATAPSEEKTSLEIQAYQSKTFEADKKTTFNSVVSVLQDLGYIVISASMETGFITAESPVKNTTDLTGALFGVRSEGRVAVTVTVEDLKATATKVRFNFVNRSKNTEQYGTQTNRDRPITDPKLYQKAFDKVDEAIFLRKSQ